jgi:hypothetical protein
MNPKNGSSDDLELDRNGNDFMAAPAPKKSRSDITKLIQVANIAPQTTKDQMQTLFGFVGKIDDIRLYPTM